MEQEKIVRKPRQTRSILTKEKILEAAFKLFCEKGYYQTTTNEIAKVANVSIGSLYSYFKDKDTIFLEILERYSKNFMDVPNELVHDIDLYQTDKKAWIRRFIEDMIKVHEISKDFNKEIQMLCYTKPEVAAIMDRQHEITRQATLDYFYLFKDDIRVKDIEAASIVCFNLISSIVDQIIFGKNTIDKERILQAGIDAVYKFIIE